MPLVLPMLDQRILNLHWHYSFYNLVKFLEIHWQMLAYYNRRLHSFRRFKLEHLDNLNHIIFCESFLSFEELGLAEHLVNKVNFISRSLLTFLPHYPPQFFKFWLLASGYLIVFLNELESVFILHHFLFGYPCDALVV